MSERDESTGQFSSAELYGRAALETEAGYVPMPEENKHGSELGLSDVADALGGEDDAQLSSTSDADIKTYSAIDGFDDNGKVSLTIEQAAKALSDVQEADGELDKLDEDNKVRDEVDKLRGVKPADKAEAKPETPAAPVKEGELDPEIERALSNPKIKEAIAHQVGEAEQSRQNYVAALQSATQVAQATFLSQFPEFASIPAEHRANALAAMAQNDPERFARIRDTVQNTTNLFEQHKAEQQRSAMKERADFQNWARQEDSRFADMMKGERDMPAIEAQIPAMLQKLGVDPREFLKAGSESKFLRSAAAQAVLAKAAKYDIIMKAAKPTAARPVPAVQKPGIAQRVSSASASEQSATDEFNRTGSLKAAQRLYALQSARRKAS